MPTRPRRSATGRSVASRASADPQVLHPKLQAALDCLEVNLEAELARYRRSRPQKGGIVRRFLVRLSGTGEPEAVPLPLQGGKTSAAAALPAAQPAGLDTAILGLRSPELDRAADQALAKLSPQGDQEDLRAALTLVQPPGPGRLPLTGPDTPDSPPPPPTRAGITTAANLLAARSPEAPLQRALRDEDEALNSAADDALGDVDSAYFAGAYGTDAYEQRGTAQQRRRDRRRSRRGGPFSTIGVATILLTFSGTVWTYYSNYPASDEHLRLAGLWERLGNTLNLDESAIAEGPAPAPSAPAEVTGLPTNLAQREFVDLNLQTLSTLAEPAPPSPSPEPLAAPSAPPTLPQVPEIPVVGAATANPKATPGANPQTNPKAKPSPSPSPKLTLGAIVPIPADGTRYYYVVATPSDRVTLETARKYVPDAYSRRFPAGSRIQFGALDTRDRAEQVAQRLLDAGIPVEIYHPKAQTP
ncbi:MAG: hypothetical protein Fur0042_16620 [Cyanophyceae cyanobacterium]